MPLAAILIVDIATCSIVEKRDKPQKRPAGKATKRAVKKIGGAKTKPKEKIRRSKVMTGGE